jgi:hypothetical protein
MTSSITCSSTTPSLDTTDVQPPRSMPWRSPPRGRSARAGAAHAAHAASEAAAAL